MRAECEKDEHGKPKDIRGASARQQDMLLWPGMELLGCTRGESKSDNVVNGAIYRLGSVTTTHVTLRIHEDDSRMAKFGTRETARRCARSPRRSCGTRSSLGRSAN